MSRFRAFSALLVVATVAGCDAPEQRDDPFGDGARRLARLAARETPPCDEAVLVEGSQPRSAELTLRCDGVREAWHVRGVGPGPREGSARFYHLEPASGVRDPTRATRLLDRTFALDPWQPPMGTFDASNAVRRRPEAAIALSLAASLALGVAFLLRARPAPGDR